MKPNRGLSPISADRRWRRVYAAVIAFTAFIILVLFLFSRHFAG